MDLIVSFFSEVLYLGLGRFMFGPGFVDDEVRVPLWKKGITVVVATVLGVAVGVCVVWVFVLVMDQFKN